MSFKAKKTGKVLSKLASKDIEVVSVPANVTHVFQPPDLTVNRDAKKSIKDQFTSRYLANVQSQLAIVCYQSNLSSSEEKLLTAKG